MFWKGLGDDTAIWWSVTRDGQHWTDQDTAPSLGQGLSQFRTSESPAVAVFGDRLHLFWKGSDDLGIWHASAFPPGRPVDGRERLFWDDHGRLDYVDPGTGGSFDYTRNAPAALAMQQMYLAGQNEDNDGIFAWSSADGIFWDPEQIVDVPGVGTSNGPALVNNATTFLGEPDKLLMFWKGAADDSSIWHSSSSDAGRNWTTQRPVPNVGTSHRPALATWGEDVYVIWKRNDAGLCWAVFSPFAGDPGVWLHPVTRDPVRPGEPKIPSVGTSHRPALTVFEPRPAVVGHFHPGRFGHATHR